MVNWSNEILHEKHPVLWRQSPFADYNRYLTTQDAAYHGRWLRYVQRYEERLQRGEVTEATEVAAQQAVFGRPFSLVERLRQVWRAARGAVNYAQAQARHRRQTATGAA